MRYKIMSVRDRAADVFGQPFFVAAVGVGIRGFKDEINNASNGNQLFKHPEDFDLYLLGEFDDSTGEFDVKRPEMVVVGKDCKESV